MLKDQININIDLFDKNNKKVLTASQYGKFIEFNSKICLNFYHIIRYLVLKL